MKSLIVVSFMLTSSLINSLALASRLEVVGEAVQVAPAEYLRLNMAVQASCHTSAQVARQEVDQTVLALHDLLKKHTDTSIGDQIQLSIGNNDQSIKTKYENQETIIVCDQDHSWESDSSVTFKLTKLSDLAKLQDEILSLAKQLNRAINTNTSGLKITLSAPEPGVLSDTWDKMSDNALKVAYNSALRQVKIIAELQQPQAQIELLKMTENRDSSGRAVYDRVTGVNDSNGNTFGQVVLKLSRLFVFNLK